MIKKFFIGTAFAMLTACDFSGSSGNNLVRMNSGGHVDQSSISDRRLASGDRRWDRFQNTVSIFILNDATGQYHDIVNQPVDYVHPDSFFRVVRAPVDYQLTGTAYAALSFHVDQPESGALALAFMEEGDIPDPRENGAEAFLLVTRAGSAPIPNDRNAIAGAEFKGSYLGHIETNRTDAIQTDYTVQGDVNLRVNSAGTGIQAGTLISNRVFLDEQGVQIGGGMNLRTDGGAIGPDFRFEKLPVRTEYPNGSTNLEQGELSGVFVDAGPNLPQGQIVGGLVLMVEPDLSLGPEPNVIGRCAPEAGTLINDFSTCTVEVGVFVADPN